MRALRTFAKLQFAIAGNVKTQIFAIYGTYLEEDLILSQGSHTFSFKAAKRTFYLYLPYKSYKTYMFQQDIHVILNFRMKGTWNCGLMLTVVFPAWVYETYKHDVLISTICMCFNGLNIQGASTICHTVHGALYVCV